MKRGWTTVIVAASAATAAVATAGCYSQQYAGEGESLDPTACQPVEGPLPASVRAERLAGEYRIILIATAGEQAGESMAGSLQLKPNPERLRELREPSAGGAPREGVSVPLYGTAKLDPESVGGVAPGDLISEDPQRPGVLVVEERAGENVPSRIFIRLGSEGNDRSRQRFDGAYFALSVSSVEDDGFSGSWSSGVESTEASGHFCAYR